MTILTGFLGFIGLSGITFALIAQRRAARRDAKHRRGIEAHLRRYQ